MVTVSRTRSPRRRDHIARQQQNHRLRHVIRELHRLLPEEQGVIEHHWGVQP